MIKFQTKIAEEAFAGLIAPYERLHGEHWVRKVVNYCVNQDADGDWVIREHDFKQGVNVEEIPKKMRKHYIKFRGKFWDRFLNNACTSIKGPRVVSFLQVIELWSDMLINKRDELELIIREICMELCWLLDDNKNGVIEAKEYFTVMRIFGLSTDQVIASFSVMDTNNNGLLEIPELVDAGVKYFCTTDENNGDLFLGELVQLKR